MFDMDLCSKILKKKQKKNQEGSVKCVAKTAFYGDCGAKGCNAD